MMLSDDQQLVGLIAVSDKVKDEAAKILKELDDMNIQTAMLTGDNKYTADAIAKQIGIKKVFAEVLPHDKCDYVAKL